MAPGSSRLLVAVVALLHAAAAGNGGPLTRYDRVFSFGDSLTDTGNALHLSATTGGPASRPPYGETFFRRPTGRASDGRLVIDFLVEALGVPHPTPYLAGKTAADFRRGVNFAFGGATALDLRFFESRGLGSFVLVSLRNQTVWFNDVLRLLGAEQRKTMATSLFLVGEIGVNDYFIGLNENRTVGEVETFVPHVVGAIRSVVTDVIAAGASAVLVPGMIPLGCEPQLLTLYRGSVDAAGYDPESGCITRLNGLAELHNRELRRALGGLRRAHPGTTIVYADLYRAVTDIIVSPREYGAHALHARNRQQISSFPCFVPDRFLISSSHAGFRHRPLDACCGGGGGAYNYDDAAFCGAAGAAACADPSEYVSWDGVHYTEAANRLVACSVLQGSHSHGADAMTTLSNSSATTEDWLHRIGCV
ncbi:GDSL esterase/lipase At5g45910-like isoform X1 [Miscanthus floridulus]|uniref:GDSL esterase/lipase At5g45910-like isoform X1 n=1 Tax=Miscanthus floridulus TaxID=154761 RepID=UPI00345963A8